MIDVLEAIALAIAAFFWDYIGFVVAFFVGTSTILLLGVHDYMRSKWLMPARDDLERARKTVDDAERLYEKGDDRVLELQARYNELKKRINISQSELRELDRKRAELEALIVSLQQRRDALRGFKL